MSETPGWDTLSQDEKDFLSMLPVHKTEAATAAAIGKERSWTKRHKKANPAFAEAIVSHKAVLQPGVLASQVAMLLPLSILELRKLITQDENRGAKIDAIRHLHKLTGFGKENNEGNTFVNQGVLNQALFEIRLSPEDARAAAAHLPTSDGEVLRQVEETDGAG
ncbi:MAG: hypothetical protein C1O27_002541 [Chloroflexi bacterium]|jgi:hypothetical protein|nr:MAG: hypothetical protein C1O27_002541 [Chloroflexota bacterium]